MTARTSYPRCRSLRSSSIHCECGKTTMVFPMMACRIASRDVAVSCSRLVWALVGRVRVGLWRAVGAVVGQLQAQRHQVIQHAEVDIAG